MEDLTPYRDKEDIGYHDNDIRSPRYMDSMDKLSISGGAASTDTNGSRGRVDEKQTQYSDLEIDGTEMQKGPYRDHGKKIDDYNVEDGKKMPRENYAGDETNEDWIPMRNFDAKHGDWKKYAAIGVGLFLMVVLFVAFTSNPASNEAGQQFDQSANPPVVPGQPGYEPGLSTPLEPGEPAAPVESAQQVSVAQPEQPVVPVPVETPAPTPPKRNVPLDIDSLRAYFQPISGDAIHNVSSPQYTAMQWIVENGLYDAAELLDAYIMAVFYYSLDGPNWKLRGNLLNPTVSVCDWHIQSAKGSYCDAGNGKGISKILFSDNRLKGTIPSEISYLSNLYQLDLISNQIHGTLPTQLGLLSHMLHLGLNANALTGTIPSEIGRMSKKSDRSVYINFSNNQLVGAIPSEIGNISLLRFFLTGINKLNGAIPYEVGNLKGLNVFNVGNNQLKGQIDGIEWEKMESLGFLWLQNNQLSGRIPSSIGKIPGPMDTLSLENNQFTGMVPQEIAELHSLKKLWFFGNRLYGNVDTFLCRNETWTNPVQIRGDSCDGANTSLITCSCCCCGTC